MEAMGVWERRTCVIVVDHTHHSYFARFEINNLTCDSLVGVKQFLTPAYQSNSQKPAYKREATSSMHQGTW